MSIVGGRLSQIVKRNTTISKLNCRSHVAENCIVATTRGLRQALTRIGCLQAFESGPTVEEPCPAEMTDYDRVLHRSLLNYVKKQCSWKSST